MIVRIPRDFSTFEIDNKNSEYAPFVSCPSCFFLKNKFKLNSFFFDTTKHHDAKMFYQFYLFEKFQFQFRH